VTSPGDEIRTPEIRAPENPRVRLICIKTGRGAVQNGEFRGGGEVPAPRFEEQT